MKLESLVIADQHAAVNTFPGLQKTPPVITLHGSQYSEASDPTFEEEPSGDDTKSRKAAGRRCGWITFLREEVRTLSIVERSEEGDPKLYSWEGWW